MTTVHLSDTQIPYPKSSEVVVLWRVLGMDTILFPTKIIAETAARMYFPSETVEQRYARIFYITFAKES